MFEIGIYRIALPSDLGQRLLQMMCFTVHARLVLRTATFLGDVCRSGVLVDFFIHVGWRVCDRHWGEDLAINGGQMQSLIPILLLLLSRHLHLVILL